MGRIKENKILIEKMKESAERKPSGTYEEMVTFHLGIIASMLADISKSLAIIAESEERDE